MESEPAAKPVESQIVKPKSPHWVFRHPILLLLGGLLVGVFVGLAWGPPRNDGAEVMVNADAAIAKAKAGEPDELIRLTMNLGRLPNYRPNKATVEQAIEHTKSDNVFEQFFGVVTLSRADPELYGDALLDYAQSGKTKLEEATLPRKEQVTLNNAVMLAIHSIGTSPAESNVKVNILSKLAEHDLPMEWGGGAANMALARQGKAGLDTLVNKILTDSKGSGYAQNALGKIRDPALLPELIKLANDATMPFEIRNPSVIAISQMATINPDAHSTFIDMYSNGGADFKKGYRYITQSLGTPEAIEALRSVSKDMTLDETTRKEFKYMVSSYGSFEDIESAMNDLVSGDTSPEMKEFIRGQIGRNPNTLVNHPDYLNVLKRGLSAVNRDGRPDNVTRSNTWLGLYRKYGQRMPLELSYPVEDSGDKKLKQASGPIYNYFVQEFLRKQVNSTNIYNVYQSEMLALEELKNIVTRYEEEE